MTILLIVLACFGVGLAARLLRRWPRLVFVASASGAGLLAMLMWLTADAPGVFFGRTLSLDPPTRIMLWTCVGAASALALFSPLTFERPSDQPLAVVANSQGAFFFWSLAPLVAAILLDSFPLAVLAWTMGLSVLMLSAQPQSEGRVGGAAQFVLLVAIGGVCLLLANRFFDLYPLTPENLDLVRNATIFLALGFGLLLAVAPFHIWVGPLADELSPLGIAFLAGVAQSVGVWLVAQNLLQVTWLAGKSSALTILLIGGILTVPTGALLTLAERRDGRLVGYLALIPLGLALIGLGLGTRLAFVGALLLVPSRAFGVALVAGGIAFSRHHVERRWRTVGAFAILLGGWAMLGLPPTLGFPARLALYRAVGEFHPAVLALVVLAHAAGLLAVVRAAQRILDEPAEPAATEVKVVPYLGLAVIVGLIFVLVILGIFPQLIADPLAAVLKAGYLK